MIGNEKKKEVLVVLTERGSTHCMTVTEAAERMGMSPQTLRIGLQQGKFPFGYAVQTSPNRFTYYIHSDRFEMWMEGKL